MASERFKGDTNFNSGGVVGGYSSADAVGAVSPTLIVLRLDPVTNRLLTSTTGEVSIQEEVPTDSTKNNPVSVWTGLSSGGDDLVLTKTIDGTDYQKTFVYTGAGPYTLTINDWSVV